MVTDLNQYGQFYGGNSLVTSGQGICGASRPLVGISSYTFNGVSSFTDMCLSKVVAGDSWSLLINQSGFLSGWGWPTPLGLLPIPNQIIKQPTPFFIDAAIGGGSFVGGVGYNIVLRKNKTISIWGETYRGSAIREPSPIENFDFVKVGATLNTAVAQKNDGTIKFFGDVNYTDIETQNISSGVFSGFDYGSIHILLQTLSGTLLGYRDYNYFGAGTVPNDLGPVSLYAAGYGYSLAIKKDGTITGWGVNGVSGDELGFPPEWTIETIRNIYGSGQLNIPHSVQQFASGNAWTGINSAFSWPGGKITKLIGGNGYAGAIVNKYTIDEFGVANTAPVNDFYVWGSNPYYDQVPEIIENIKDANIGKRSMLLIDSGNNLVYYGFNSGWSSDTREIKNIFNADFYYTGITGNFNNFCLRTFITGSDLLNLGTYNLTGNYLFDLGLKNQISVIFGDQLIHDSGSFFMNGNVKYYPIAAGFKKNAVISGSYTLEEAKGGSDLTARRIWQAGVGNNNDWSYNFKIGVTNLVLKPNFEYCFSNAGKTLARGGAGFINGIGSNTLISAIEVLPAGNDSLAWDCRFNPAIVSKCTNPRPLRSDCLNDFAIADWVYKSYTAQVSPQGDSDKPLLKNLEDISGFFNDYAHGFELSASICGTCPPARELKIIFTKSGFENGFTPEGLNNKNFASTMAYWLMDDKKNETYWQESTSYKYQNFKDFFRVPLETDNEFIHLIFKEECCSTVPYEASAYRSDGSIINNINPNFGPRTVNFQMNNEFKDEYILTSDPKLFAYSRTNTGEFTGSYENLRSLHCLLDFSPHLASPRNVSYIFAGKVNTSFVDNLPYPVCVDGMGIISESETLNNTVFILANNRSPILNDGYYYSGRYGVFNCLTNETDYFSTSFQAKKLDGINTYWTNEGITRFKEYSNRDTQTVNRLDNSVYNGVSRSFYGFGENFNILKIKKNMRLFLDILRRGDQGASNFGESQEKWGLMSKRFGKEPFSYLSLPFEDQNLPINTKLNLNKFLWQVVDKASSSPNSEASFSNFFVKEGSLSNESFFPRLLFPIKIDFEFNANGVLFSGDLNNNEEFNNNYIIGLQVLNPNSEIPTEKERLLINNNSPGWHDKFSEVPSGYIRSNFSKNLLIKSGYKYIEFRNSDNTPFDMPIFEDIEHDYQSYLNENQRFWNFNRPIFIPPGHSIGLQIYSLSMGRSEEDITYNNIQDIYGYVLPKEDGAEFKFTPLNFQILDGDNPYLDNPDYENLTAKQYIINSPISNPIEVLTSGV